VGPTGLDDPADANGHTSQATVRDARPGGAAPPFTTRLPGRGTASPTAHDGGVAPALWQVQRLEGVAIDCPRTGPGKKVEVDLYASDWGNTRHR